VLSWLFTPLAFVKEYGVWFSNVQLGENEGQKRNRFYKGNKHYKWNRCRPLDNYSIAGFDHIAKEDGMVGLQAYQQVHGDFGQRTVAGQRAGRQQLLRSYPLPK